MSTTRHTFDSPLGVGVVVVVSLGLALLLIVVLVIGGAFSLGGMLLVGVVGVAVGVLVAGCVVAALDFLVVVLGVAVVFTLHRPSVPSRVSKYVALPAISHLGTRFYVYFQNAQVLASGAGSDVLRALPELGASGLRQEKVQGAFRECSTSVSRDSSPSRLLVLSRPTRAARWRRSW